MVKLIGVPNKQSDIYDYAWTRGEFSTKALRKKKKQLIIGKFQRG